MRVKWLPWGGKSLDELDEDDLYGLRERGVSESYFIEYKQKWDPFKVARAVASFANSEGGTVVVGVQDDAMVPIAVDGIDFKGNLTESLDQAIRQHVSPIPMYSSVVVPLPDDKVSLVVEVPSGHDTPYILVKTGQILERSNTSSDPVPPHNRERIRELFSRGKSGAAWATQFIRDSLTEDDRPDHLKTWTVPQVEGGLNLNSVLYRPSFVQRALSEAPVPYQHSSWNPVYETAEFHLAINQQLAHKCTTEIQLDGIIFTGWTLYQDTRWVPVRSDLPPLPIQGEDSFTYQDVRAHIEQVLRGHHAILHELIGYTGPVSVLVKGVFEHGRYVQSYRTNVSIEALPSQGFHESIHRDLDRFLGQAVLDPED